MTTDPVRAQFEARVSTYADRAAARLQRMISHDDMGKVYSELAMREDIKAVLAERAALAAQEGGGGERYEVVSKRTGAVWLTTSDPHYIDDWVTRDAFIMRPCAAQEGTGNAE